MISVCIDHLLQGETPILGSASHVTFMRLIKAHASGRILEMFRDSPEKCVELCNEENLPQMFISFCQVYGLINLKAALSIAHLLPQTPVQLRKLSVAHSVVALRHWHSLMHIVFVADCLEDLNVSYCSLADQHVSELLFALAVGPHTHITSLDVSFNPKITFRGGGQIVKWASATPSLTKVVAEGTSMPASQLERLSGSER